MSTRRWWKMLGQWIRSEGLSREEVARRSGHEPAHVLAYFDDREPGARLGLFLDVVAAAGGRLSALAGNDVGDAARYLDQARDDSELSIAALAEGAGMLRPHLSRILRSDRQNMALTTFDGLVNALGVWEALEIVEREAVEEVQSLAAVGSGMYSTATSRASRSSRSSRPAGTPGQLRVVPIFEDDDELVADDADDNDGDIREALRIAEESRRLAEEEKDKALARAKRAERATRQAKRRIEELVALVDEAQVRIDEVEQETAEATALAEAETERADQAELRAAVETERADQAEVRAAAATVRADQEHRLALQERRRAHDAQAQVQAALADATRDRGRAQALAQDVQTLTEKLAQADYALAQRSSGWLSKVGLAAGGAAIGGLITHAHGKKKTSEPAT